MPGGDRTGPTGAGPMTGRGAGYCGGSGTPGFVSRMCGAFLGRGRGGGHRWRNMVHATGAFRETTREQELDALKQQADQAAGMLDSIRRRISELEGKATQ